MAIPIMLIDDLGSNNNRKKRACTPGKSDVSLCLVFMFCEFELIPLLIATYNLDLWSNTNSNEWVYGMDMISIDYDDDKLCYNGITLRMLL